MQLTNKVQDRVRLLRAMNEVAGAVNEADFYEEYWINLTPDNDPYELNKYADEQLVEMGLTDDTTFLQVMDNFLNLMVQVAGENCGGIGIDDLNTTVGNEG